MTGEGIMEDLQRCVRDGKPVALQTKAMFTAGAIRDMSDRHQKVYASHVYNLEGVDTAKGTVDLANPHGRNHLPGLSLSRLQEYFELYVTTKASIR